MRLVYRSPIHSIVEESLRQKLRAGWSRTFSQSISGRITVNQKLLLLSVGRESWTGIGEQSCLAETLKRARRRHHRRRAVIRRSADLCNAIWKTSGSEMGTALSVAGRNGVGALLPISPFVVVFHCPDGLIAPCYRPERGLTARSGWPSPHLAPCDNGVVETEQQQGKLGKSRTAERRGGPLHITRDFVPSSWAVRCTLLGNRC